MKMAQTVRFGAWFLIGANLLTSLGAIWVFSRMTPAIDMIISRNERSLQACEEMLAALVDISDNRDENNLLKESFAAALKTAENNVTEKDEPLALAAVQQYYTSAFQGDRAARESTVAAILDLGRINRAAMVTADIQAHQLGNAGVWAIVFMGTGVFFFGMLFVRNLGKRVIRPVEEMHSVITAFRSGDRMRRCAGTDLPKDTGIAFRNLNELLDMFPVAAKNDPA